MSATRRTRPHVFYPKTIVVLDCLFDDQVDGPGGHATFAAIPVSVEVTRNDARHADTARVELDYRDFPLDPRLIQDILLTVHIVGVSGPQTPAIPSGASRRFVGRVDVPETSLGNEAQVVHLDARDYTGIWLDFKWDPKNEIPTPPGRTLGAVVEYIRAKVTPNTGRVVFSDAATELLDVNARTGRSQFAPESDDDSAWEVLSALCDRFGLVPVWNLDILQIRTPTESSTSVVQMVYGANVQKLTFKRSLKQQKKKQVKVVAWNPVLGRVFEAQWPPDSEVERLEPGEEGEQPKKKKTVKQVQYNVQGPYDSKTLLDLAKSVHAELAQGQLEGEIETRDLVDIGGLDLLGLQNGDRLVCKLGPQDQASISAMSSSEAIDFLSDQNRPNHLDRTVAMALVQAWTAAQRLAVQFYLLEVTHRWEREDGYTFSARFSEFVLGV